MNGSREGLKKDEKGIGCVMEFRICKTAYNKSAPSRFAGLRTVAPEAGFEPATLRLTAACSTIELLRNVLLLYELDYHPSYYLIFASVREDLSARSGNNIAKFLSLVN